MCKSSFVPKSNPPPVVVVVVAVDGPNADTYMSMKLQVFHNRGRVD